ncbi:MAG: dihydroorotase [Thermodesulfobacteriota bacterium]|nr:dihydroorotase [Thermodesulfobacteriota bacterium]
MRTLIRGGRVIDPGQGLDDLREVLIEDGQIKDLAVPGQEGGFADGALVIEAQGLVVTPGLIDMHVHLREPGEEYKETISSGAAAAAAGGFTAVAAMPNTNPINDNRSVTEFILGRAREAGSVRVWPIAAMTRGSLGQELCEYGDLAEAGAVAVSDDGRPVSNARMMRRVLEYAKVFDLRAISHAEELTLSAGGVMNEGVISTALGLTGIPAAAEETAVFREVCLAGLTGAPVHIAHVSTAGSVDIIRQAKADGRPVTAETAPHYFSLTEEAVRGYRTEAKMNPPLRTKRDLMAVRAGLADGTLDAIAGDHAPHSVLEKEVEFDQAAFGIVGLETSLPLALNLFREGILSLARIVTALSLNPARILGVPGGSLGRGQDADVTIIDLDRQWKVDASRFKSKGRNTPFDGLAMTGQAVLTMVQGLVIHNILP